MVTAPPHVIDLKCWRCDRKIGEAEGEIVGKIILECRRCGARNVFPRNQVDNSDNNGVK